MTDHRRRARRAAALLATAAAVAVTAAGTACFELSGPGEGVFSVDRIIMPSFAVALKDSLRDSTAKATPLRVVARDAAGNVIEDASVQFVALDPGIIILDNKFLRGDSIRTGARVIALVGPDKLQTPPETVAVTPPPVSAAAVPADTVIAFPYPAFGTSDTLSAPFGLLVSTTDATPLQHWEVRFTIESSTVVPADTGLVPVRLTPATGRGGSAVATTAEGLGQVRLRLTPFAVKQGSPAGTVRVRAFTTVGVGASARVFSRVYVITLTPTS